MPIASDSIASSNASVLPQRFWSAVDARSPAGTAGPRRTSFGAWPPSAAHDRPSRDTFKDAGVLPPDIVVRRDPDGTIRAHSPHPLGPYPERLTEKLDFWAALAPERCFLAERDTEGAWTRLTYGEARARVRRIAQALIDRRLSTDRTVLILSGNSREHALLALAAMYVGVPYAPAAPAYSLLVNDHSTLGKLVETMRPGLIFAATARIRAGAARSPSARRLTWSRAHRPRTFARRRRWSSRPLSRPAAVDDAHARVKRRRWRRCSLRRDPPGVPRPSSTRTDAVRQTRNDLAA